MAIACLGFVTFLPLRPDLSLPRFISLISVSTFLPADGEYFRREDFFADDFFADDFLADDFLADDFLAEGFFAEDFFAPVLRRLLLFFAEVLFRVLLDLFFAAFFVAIHILPENQMSSGFETVVWRSLKSDLLGDCARLFRLSGITPLAHRGGRCGREFHPEEIRFISRASATTVENYTTRRTPGMRTSGSAMNQQAMQESIPVTPNFSMAGATQ